MFGRLSRCRPSSAGDSLPRQKLILLALICRNSLNFDIRPPASVSWEEREDSESREKLYFLFQEATSRYHQSEWELIEQHAVDLAWRNGRSKKTRLERKLDHLQHQQKVPVPQDSSTKASPFYKKVENLTNEVFSFEEISLLEKGLKHNPFTSIGKSSLRDLAFTIDAAECPSVSKALCAEELKTVEPTPLGKEERTAIGLKKKFRQKEIVALKADKVHKHAAFHSMINRALSIPMSDSNRQKEKLIIQGIACKRPWINLALDESTNRPFIFCLKIDATHRAIGRIRTGISFSSSVVGIEKYFYPDRLPTGEETIRPVDIGDRGRIIFEAIRLYCAASNSPRPMCANLPMLESSTEAFPDYEHNRYIGHYASLQARLGATFYPTHLVPDPVTPQPLHMPYLPLNLFTWAVFRSGTYCIVVFK
ncbi:unnamed protein product [Nesidiocoris tenuis]|uniref:Uncharacterized protein n=1 Tax=Nesidiocoris tenuis TaxID=355587 RepID=A0A6H5GEW7_9HEMI|nr:unnamed protein product [Nesidiocoris tenuis]